MQYKATRHFWKGFQKLPPEMQKKAREAFKRFKDNPRHPGLETHHIHGTKNPKIYEGYLSKQYRFTFVYEDDTIVFRKIGKHDIIDEEARG